MKTRFGAGIIAAMLIFQSLTFVLQSLAMAQVELKLKLPKPKSKSSTEPQSKENISTDSRIEVRHFEHSMNLLRKLLKETNPPDIEGARDTLVLAKQSLNEVKRRYPDYSTAKLEREIAEYDKMVSGADSAAASEEEMKAYIKKTAYYSGQLIPANYWKGIYTNSAGDAERYFEKCKDLNYSENMKRINELLATHPQLRNDSQIRSDIEQLLTKFPKEYDEFVRSFLIREINASIEKAYVEKQKGKSSMAAATEAANIALTLAKGVLLTFPDQPQALRVRKDAETIAGAVDSELASKVYAGAFHKEHAGQVVYSRKPLVAGQEDASAVTKSFSLTDNIYAMAYFKGTISEMADNAPASQTEMQITIFLDGNQMTEFNYRPTKPMESWTFMPIEVLPSLDTAKDCAGAVKYAQLFATCSPRNHTVGFRISAIYMSSRHDLAQGEFEIDCTRGQEKMADLAVAYHKIALKNVFLPKPAKVEAVLERSMVEATRGMLIDRNRPGVPQRAVITEREWTLYRHPISGVITRRAINGAVAVKQNDGTCRFYQMTFSEVYNGGFGRLHWTSVDDGTEMDCGNVMK